MDWVRAVHTDLVQSPTVLAEVLVLLANNQNKWLYCRLPVVSLLTLTLFSCESLASMNVTISLLQLLTVPRWQSGYVLWYKFTDGWMYPVWCSSFRLMWDSQGEYATGLAWVRHILWLFLFPLSMFSSCSWVKCWKLSKAHLTPYHVLVNFLS